MKRQLTIKLKITLWFTAFMVALSVLFFSFMTIVTQSSNERLMPDTIVELVHNNIDQLDEEGGSLEIDDDFIYIKDSVYSLIYTERGEQIAGLNPYQ